MAALVLVAGSATPSAPLLPSNPTGGGWGRRPSAALDVVPPPVVLPPKPLPPLPANEIPADGIAWARRDAATLPTAVLPFVRWIWLPNGDKATIRALSDVLNKISRSASIVQPAFHGIPGKGGVLRVYFRDFAPRDSDVQEWLCTWELLQFDPWFSTLVTKDTIKELTDAARQAFIVRQSWIMAQGAKRFPQSFTLKLVDLKDVVVARQNALHLAGSGIEELQALTGSLAPVVHASYFTARATSSIKDKDGDKESVFSTIWGGLYYEFAGIRKAQNKNITDLDQLFFDIGVGDGKTPFQKVLDDRFRSDERAAMGSSGVTKKRRRIDWVSNLAARVTQANPIVFITNDVAEKDVAPGSDPFKNLQKFDTAAFEVMWFRANGMQGYAIFDSKGKLLEVADQSVVEDSTVPNGYPKRLQIIGCIRCHGQSIDGWQPFTNEVRSLLQRGPQVFADLTVLNASAEDTRIRIRDWYNAPQSRIDKVLSRARDDYAAVVLEATNYPLPVGGFTTKRPAWADVVPVASSKIGDLYAEDRYTLVDAATALRDMGFASPAHAEEAAAMLGLMLPPDVRARDPITGIIPEDATFARLKAGLRVSRAEFMLSYAFGLDRANQQRRKK